MTKDNTDPAMIAMGLSEAQRELVLDVLGADDDFGFYSFNAAAKALGTTRDVVRRAIHGLRDLGLVTFQTGLMTDEGELYGSGYALNRDGLQIRTILSAPSSRNTPTKENNNA